ncbi:cell division protein [Actinobacillus equuli]|nr:cell division protein [Actinobacillus equuli]
MLLTGGIGLWVLKENAPTQAMPVAQPTQSVQQPQGPALPSRPEEVYSYIRDLETREVLTDNSQKSQEKLAQLSAEQKQQLEAKLKQEEAARLAAEKLATQPEATTPAASTETVTEAQPAVVALTPEELAAKKAAEQKAAKLAEEKRKQAELKKQQDLAKQNQVPVETAKPVETAASIEAKLSAEKAKKAEQTKVVASAAKPADKAANQAGRFGLQCGAFKNKAQAENMQARLAMAGFNARISSNSDWNRVFVGPVGDRAAASNAQSNARSVAECVIISM